MGFISNIFKKKSAVPTAASGAEYDEEVLEYIRTAIRERANSIEHVVPRLCGEDWMGMFNNIPEVCWPIHYIASRIAGAKFLLKKSDDDTVVWNTSQGIGKKINDILCRPNCITSFEELVYQHFVYRLCTGNAYMRAAMGAGMNENTAKYLMCSNYWELPAHYVEIEPAANRIPLFGIASSSDIIKQYVLKFGAEGKQEIPTWQIWHDRDNMPSMRRINSNGDLKCLKGVSRLSAQRKPISNLIAVYEARNIIYVKRGGLGFITNMRKDDTGDVALNQEEKKELLDQYHSNYGIGSGKSPVAFSNAPISFVRTNLSIADLQPFDETLADAISIAAVYGIPAVLVPRKDQSTFSNQATAEKSVYCGTVIPLAKQFCKQFSNFLGIEERGYYLDCDFSDVDCLQQGMKEAEEVKEKVNKRCADQFDRGLITLNDWRAQIGESNIEDIELFSKLKFQMTDEELAIVDKVTKSNPNTKIVEDGEIQKPTVQD